MLHENYKNGRPRKIINQQGNNGKKMYYIKKRRIFSKKYPVSSFIFRNFFLMSERPLFMIFHLKFTNLRHFGDLYLQICLF